MKLKKKHIKSTYFPKLFIALWDIYASKRCYIKICCALWINFLMRIIFRMKIFPKKTKPLIGRENLMSLIMKML